MITNSLANTQPDSEKTNIKKVKDLKSIFEKGPEHHHYKPFQPA